MSTIAEQRPRFFAAPRAKFCQGLCDALKNNPPYGKKYVSHVFCSRCSTNNGVWMLKEAMKANGRCPCCNFLPRRRPRNGFK